MRISQNMLYSYLNKLYQCQFCYSVEKKFTGSLFSLSQNMLCAKLKLLIKLVVSPPKPNNFRKQKIAGDKPILHN